ncbi:Hsp20/alpha crystallin family protein [Alicyclobacillus dauci]|uniref:Hsp20/alpha crystallin family protein n=1 Tax=Alicyclobacillus dauci TaxID=1475485 RepID=A0ABY6Z2V7_9BACL|nr:Hsp20/alpha crystallin family protein [Alicyclobacillus dauci]WAH37227.1 Hsp20/alpha crystallin family protein [Alicyclobacillus dauci]
MANNPMDYLKQLEQMGEQIRQMFGSQDFLKNMMPNMPDFLNTAQTMGNPPNPPGFNSTAAQYPRVDLYEPASDLVAVVEVPGLQSASDVAVSVEVQRLYIKGSLNRSYANIPRNQLHLSELHHGIFEREITLPLPVLRDEVRAEYRNGLLSIIMRKDLRHPEQSRGQSVPIDF